MTKMLNNFRTFGFNRYFLLVIMSVALLGSACSKSGRESPEAVAARNAELDAKLKALKIDVNISEFHRVFGEPTATDARSATIFSTTIQRHARPKKVEETFTYTEYQYENDHFYVQAVADEAGKVGMYTITARSAEYLPVIQTILGHPIQLGKSVYTDLEGTARKVAAHFSGNPERPFYYEIVVTNTLEPEIAVVATNPNGYVEKIGRLTQQAPAIFVKWFSLSGMDFPADEEHAIFRKNTTINTYGRAAEWFRGLDNTGEGANFGEAAIHIGPRVTPVDKQQK